MYVVEMICPVCWTTTAIAYAPSIAVGVSGVVAAKMMMAKPKEYKVVHGGKVGTVSKGIITFHK